MRATEFAGLLVRNPKWVTKNARHAWATTKVMRQYRKDHPKCAFCHRDKRVQIHHIIPVSVNDQLAAHYVNLLTLCAKRCHITVGHAGNYKNFVDNVKFICRNLKVFKTKGA